MDKKEDLQKPKNKTSVRGLIRTDLLLIRKNNKILNGSIIKWIMSILPKLLTLLVAALWLIFLPGHLGLKGFGYFNMFLMYVANLTILQFGFKEGILARYGDYKMEELPVPLLRTYSRIFVLFQFVLSTIIMVNIWGVFSDLSDDMSFVLIMTFANLLFVNGNGYYDVLTTLADDKVFKGSIQSIQRSINVFIFIPLLLFQFDYKFLIVVFTASNVIAFLMYSYKYRRIYVGGEREKTSIKDILGIYRFGFPIMLSQVVAILIFGIDRLSIKMNFPDDIELFASYLFAGSVVAVVIQLVSQGYSTIFTLIKKSISDKNRQIYQVLTVVVIVFSSVVLSLTFFVSFIVRTFLPDYVEAIPLIKILIPAMLFRTEISIVKRSFVVSEKRKKGNFRITMLLLVSSVIFNITFFSIFGTAEAIAFASLTTFVVGYLAYDIYFSAIGYAIMKRKYLFIIFTLLNYTFYVYVDLFWWVKITGFLAWQFILSLALYTRLTMMVVKEIYTKAK